MHITRCDDPAYLSFARQLLRSLSNVKDGTVTKHIGDVTVTVRKVFGHEYVSIASGDVVYEFFTTGDLYNSLEGLDLEHLAKTEKYIIPRGYFIRAKSNGDAQLVLSTNKPFIGEKGSCCSETYLVVGTFPSETIAVNCISYMTTRFFRFLVLLKKNTQNAAKGVYQFVPIQDFSESWTDEKLYKKYGLTQEEIAFIESMIRPMELES